MILRTRPFNWISAHREATFTFDYDNVFTLISVSDNGGKASFYFDYDGLHNLEVGDYFWINSGEYKGYHKVRSIPFPFLYIAETDYTTGQMSGTMTFIEDQVVTISVGYNTGQANAALVAVQPYKIIAEFKPEPNVDGQLVFNISGYVNKLFDVLNSNDTITFTGVTVYYNLFAQYQINVNGVYFFTGNVLNSAITQYELNRDYVGTNRNLNGGALGNHYIPCGIYDVMAIYGDWVVQQEVYTDGVPGGSAVDFDPADFSASDFQTT